MTDDFAARVTQALRAVKHAPTCASLIPASPAYPQPALRCDCDRETRQGALVAQAIDATVEAMEDELHMGLADEVSAIRAAALRVLNGDAHQETRHE